MSRWIIRIYCRFKNTSVYTETLCQLLKALCQKLRMRSDDAHELKYDHHLTHVNMSGSSAQCSGLFSPSTGHCILYMEGHSEREKTLEKTHKHALNFTVFRHNVYSFCVDNNTPWSFYFGGWKSSETCPEKLTQTFAFSYTAPFITF